MQLNSVFRKARQWLWKTPERALDQAHEAALMIEEIERKHFDGKPISALNGTYGQSSMAFFEGELQKYLNLIKIRMTEFKTSSRLLRVSDPKMLEVQVSTHIPSDYTVDVIDKPAIFFKKLRFVDEVLERYGQLDSPEPEPPLIEVSRNGASVPHRRTEAAIARQERGLVEGNPVRDTSLKASALKAEKQSSSEGLSERASVLPRSILRTVDRIRQDLDPKAEVQVVRNFRSSKSKTTIALKFILLLIIVPLLTQQVSKTFIVGPIVDYVRGETHAEVFLNMEMEEEALHELQQFEERLRFEILLGKAKPVPELEIEKEVREKATEIESEYQQRSANAVNNVFADMLAALSFGGVLILCRREVSILKDFIDEIVYGLSDSAKAFIIILFTDIFVGFHSPHGWEVLLEGLSHHLGFPANRDFIFLFIATFPVILDTVFKYWIFRYLNRISPSAVATYKNMNE